MSFNSKIDESLGYKLLKDISRNGQFGSGGITSDFD